MSWLTPHQQRTYTDEQYFDVVGNVSGTVYRINTYTTTSNVATTTKDGRRVNYCCYPRNANQIPAQDIFLAQALSITANEEAWLEKAIASGEPFQHYNWGATYYGGARAYGGAYGYGGAGGGHVAINFYDWVE